MGKTPHQLIGLATGIALIPVVATTFQDIPIVLLFAFVGGTAPDGMEFSYNANAGNRGVPYQRASVIPHRTFTHWFVFWVAALYFSFHYYRYNHEAMISIIPFILGGISHLVADASTISGIPLFHPFSSVKIRYSRFKSGSKHEIIVAFILIFVAIITQEVFWVNLFRNLFHNV